MIRLIVDLKKLAHHKSSIKPPSLISSPFQKKKVIKPPSLFCINYRDCNASWGLIIRYVLFTSWKFGFHFDLQLHDLQLHVPELFQFALSFFIKIEIIPQSSLNPLGPNSVQHQFSPNNISRSTKVKVIRITELMTKARIL